MNTVDAQKTAPSTDMTLEDFLSSADTDVTDNENNWDSDSHKSSQSSVNEIPNAHFLRNNAESKTDPATTSPPTIPTPTNPSNN